VTEKGGGMTVRCFALIILMLFQPIVSPALAQDNPPIGRFAALVENFEDAGIIRTADVVYATIPGAEPVRLSLDVYAARKAKSAPVIVFFHGGSWQRGNKSAIGRKPLHFVPAGYVMVSATYRFRPEVTVAEMATDVARAVAWVKSNISQFGGDPERLILMGHSAGAHLVSLVGTNGHFLEQVGLSLTDIDSVISLDTGLYDVAAAFEHSKGGHAKMIRTVFPADPRDQATVSPIVHVGTGKAIPPFLVVASDGRPDLVYQAEPFTKALTAAGIVSSLYIGKDRTHISLNSELGGSGDPTTQAIMKFLEESK
jgi:arylformamidase